MIKNVLFEQISKIVIIMTNIDFSSLNKNASNSFNHQRNQIKKVLRGDSVLCEQCKQPLTLIASDKAQAQIGCVKQCTLINMDID